MVIPTLKNCYFEVSEDIMTKFKLQALHIIRIKCWKAIGSRNPPSFIPTLQKIALLGLKAGLWEWYTGISVRGPNFTPHPPRVDKNGHFTYYLPFVTWPSVDFLLTPKPLFSRST